MRRIGATPSSTLAIGLLLVLVGCNGSSPTSPTRTPTPTPAPPLPIMWSGNGHHYQLSLTLENEADHFLTWTQARARAENLSFQGVSGHLVTISSAAENAFLIDRIVPAQRTPAPLIGGFQPPGSPEPDGGWQWVTGEPFVYTNWAPLEPNEAVPDADFLVFTADTAPLGTWNDVADIVSIYIIEYDTSAEAPITVIGNLPASGDAEGVVIHGRGWHTGVTAAAAGFAMGGTSLSLSSVDLRLEWNPRFSSGEVPLVQLYSDVAGQPDAPVLTLVNPAFAELGTYSFTPVAPFTLEAATTYWIVISNVGPEASFFYWRRSSPPIAPTGAFATNAGYRVGFPGPWRTATVGLYSYAVMADMTTVP